MRRFFAVFMVAFALAVTWPVALVANRIHPLILGLPLSMAWGLFWVVASGFVLALLHWSESRRQGGDS